VNPAISIMNRHPRYRPAHEPQLRLARQVFKGEGKRGTVDIILGDAAMLRSLNRQFRHTAKTTDILSFPFGEQGRPDESGYWGEIYINLDRLHTEAERESATMRDALALRVAHGLLHLFGYDHIDDPDARQMIAREKRYLKKAGFSSALPLVNDV